MNINSGNKNVLIFVNSKLIRGGGYKSYQINNIIINYKEDYEIN